MTESKTSDEDKRPIGTVQLYSCEHHGMQTEAKCADCRPLPRLPQLYSYGNDKGNPR